MIRIGAFCFNIILVATFSSCHFLSSHDEQEEIFPVYISANQALDDIKMLTEIIENNIPDAFRNSSRYYYEDIKSAIVEKMEDSISVHSFYSLLYPLINQLHDAHFSLNYSDKYLSKFNILLFPISVYVEDDRIFVFKDHSSTPIFTAGQEIISINSVSAQNILQALNGGFHIDVTYKKFLERRLESVFPYRLYALLRMSGSFNIETKDTLVQINGRRYDELLPMRGPHYIFEVYYGDIAYLKIGTLTHDFDSLNMWLERDFSRIHSLGIKKLIIDIRGNLGGSTRQAKRILDYIYDGPYTMAVGMKYYKKGKIVEVTNDVNSHQPEPVNNRLSGDVVLMSDVLTYSSAHMMQVAFQYFNMGQTIGQKSSESLNVSGELVKHTLTHSRLEFTAPTTIFYLPGYSVDKRKHFEPEIINSSAGYQYLMGIDSTKNQAIEFLE